MFDSDLSAGKNAENIFRLFAGQLFNSNVIMPVQSTDSMLEGADLFATSIAPGGILTGSVEVKAMLNNNFIRRDNNLLLPCGTLDFELFSNAWGENGRMKDRTVWTPGWLLGMLHLEEMRSYNRRNGRESDVCIPSVLAFMLCRDANGLEPYACICFDDFAMLKRRLYEIAPFDIDQIPKSTSSCWRTREWNIPYNVWYVSLDKLIDLARIIIFEDVHMVLSHNSRCPIDIQKARGRYLSEHACFSFNSRDEYENAIKAGMAYNRDMKMPIGTQPPNMTYFDPERLPSYVKRYTAEEAAEWLSGWLE